MVTEELWVTVALLAVKEVRGVTPPTAPPMVIDCPPAVAKRDRACPPLIAVVEVPNVILPVVAVTVKELPKVPIKLVCWVTPELSREAQEMLFPNLHPSRLPVVLTVRAPIGVVPPTTPPNWTVPLPALKVSACAPSMVDEKVMFELLVVQATVPVDRLTGPVQLMAPPPEAAVDALIAPAMLMAVAPV